MKKGGAVLALVAISALALAATPRRSGAVVGPMGQTCPRAGTRVLFIGDSNGNGLAGTAFGARKPLVKLAEACGTPLHVDVLGGKGAPYFAPRIGADLAAAQPTITVVNLAGNDYRRNDTEHVQQSIAAIVTAIRAAGSKLVWSEPPSFPFPDGPGVVAAWLAHQPIVFPLSRYADLERASDGIHYPLSSYDEWAKRLWQFIAEVS